MKTKTTKRAIMNTFTNVIKVGYCDMQSALAQREPNFYTAGVYGWNADVYVIDTDTVIVTGYRPYGNVELSRNVIDTLNTCAKSARQSFNYDAAESLARKNLDELAGGIEFDFDSFFFHNGNKTIEIKRK